ncbi:MAG: hypothetical protein WCK15_14730 [Pirellula sp.]
MSNDKRRTTNPKIKSLDLKGVKNLHAVAALLEPLDKMGTNRGKARNRDLYMDQALPERTSHNFSAIDKSITAVDGSVCKVLSHVAKLALLAVGNRTHRGGYCLQTQLEVFRGQPSRISTTGKSSSKRTYEMICFYFSGLASLEEFEEHQKAPRSSSLRILRT